MSDYESLVERAFDQAFTSIFAVLADQLASGERSAAEITASFAKSLQALNNMKSIALAQKAA